METSDKRYRERVFDDVSRFLCLCFVLRVCCHTCVLFIFDALEVSPFFNSNKEKWLELVLYHILKNSLFWRKIQDNLCAISWQKLIVVPSQLQSFPHFWFIYFLSADAVIGKAGFTPTGTLNRSIFKVVLIVLAGKTRCESRRHFCDLNSLLKTAKHTKWQFNSINL